MSYMVSVEGCQAPKKIHQLYEDAQTEAKRLSEQPENRNRTIYVLKVVTKLKPVSTHQWEFLA